MSKIRHKPRQLLLYGERSKPITDSIPWQVKHYRSSVKKYPTIPIINRNILHSAEESGYYKPDIDSRVDEAREALRGTTILFTATEIIMRQKRVENELRYIVEMIPDEKTAEKLDAIRDRAMEFLPNVIFYEESPTINSVIAFTRVENDKEALEHFLSKGLPFELSFGTEDPHAHKYLK